MNKKILHSLFEVTPYPLTLSPVFWLDYNKGLTVDSSNRVSSWRDRTGSLSFIQATLSEQPLLDPNGICFWRKTLLSSPTTSFVLTTDTWQTYYVIECAYGSPSNIILANGSSGKPNNLLTDEFVNTSATNIRITPRIRKNDSGAAVAASITTGNACSIRLYDTWKCTVTETFSNSEKRGDTERVGVYSTTLNNAIASNFGLGGFRDATTEGYFRLKQAIAFDRILSTEEEDALFLYFSQYEEYKGTGLKNVIFDGNSLTRGNQEELTSGSYPDQIRLLLNQSFTIKNVAITGRTTAQIDSDAATNTDIHIIPDADENVYVVFEFVNDLNVSGLTPQQSYDALELLCNNRRAAGFTQIVVVTPIAGNVGVVDYELKRQEFITLLRNGYTDFADYLVDLADNPFIGLDGAQNNATYYQADGIHLKAAGYLELANEVYDVINTI